MKTKAMLEGNSIPTAVRGDIVRHTSPDGKMRNALCAEATHRLLRLNLDRLTAYARETRAKEAA